jgi:transcriptional regulator with XRE-family HTH domain
MRRRVDESLAQVHQRQRLGLSVGQAARRLGVKVGEYRELEAGTWWPSFDAYERAAKLYGWPRSFTRRVSRVT